MGETQKKRLLWVGDAGCTSGFALATHSILETVRKHYDVTVLAMNYNGDEPDRWPYRMYLAGVGGDGFGVNRVAQIANKVGAEVIVIQQDGWNIPAYMQKLRMFKETVDIPVVAAVAVDGANFNGQWLRGVRQAIFWTEFASREARAGGWRGPTEVIPLGVDLDTYKPYDQAAVRRVFNPAFRETLSNPDNFIVGVVGRNQPRKRLDLAIRYFAKWIEDKNISNAWLYIHAAPTGEACVNVVDLARYYNCLDRVLHVEPPVFVGVTEEQMCLTYNCFDLLVSTTQGEGFGLPALEAMACGVPCVLPHWSGFGDWAHGAAALVACTSTRVDQPYENVIGGVVDEREFIDELDRLYRDPALRKRWAELGHQRACEDRFRWERIGARYVETLDRLLAGPATEAEWQDLGRQEGKEQPTTSREVLLERRVKILSGEVPA